MRKIFFALQRSNGRLNPVLHYDEFRPSAFALGITDYACEVDPIMRGWSAMAIAAEIEKRRAAEMLPANLVRK